MDKINPSLVIGIAALVVSTSILLWNIGGSISDVRADISDLRTELIKEVSNARAELARELSNTRAELTKEVLDNRAGLRILNYRLTVLEGAENPKGIPTPEP